MVLKLTFCIFVLPTLIQCSKYDVDTESQKLYGEDLQGILNRFRRSYDYLTILEEKHHILMLEFEDSNYVIDEYYTPMIQTRVKELLGMKTEGGKKENDKEPEKVDKRLLRLLRDGEEDESKDQDDVNDVKILDNYVMGMRYLTVPEINTFANVGYEYAGKIIHGLIASMGGTIDNSLQVTKISAQDDGNAFAGSTRHPKDHIVSNDGQYVTQKVTEPTTQPDDNYSYRAFSQFKDDVGNTEDKKKRIPPALNLWLMRQNSGNTPK